MSQQRSDNVSGEAMIEYLGNFFCTSSIEKIFLEAACVYMEDTHTREARVGIDSIKKGVENYLNMYQVNSLVPFYLRIVYERILIDATKQEEEKISIIAT